MSISRPVTEEDLFNLRSYFYTEGGKLFAKYSYANRVSKDQEVGTKTGKVLTVMCKGKHYLVHRVIYFLNTGLWPTGVIDHIDGNSLNNDPSNLRDITQSENTKSYSPAHKDSTSKYRGVHWYPSKNKWQAQIMCNGKREHLGYFPIERCAALAWNKRATELGFNEEALNKIDTIKKIKELQNE